MTMTCADAELAFRGRGPPPVPRRINLVRTLWALVVRVTDGTAVKVAAQARNSRRVQSRGRERAVGGKEILTTQRIYVTDKRRRNGLRKRMQGESAGRSPLHGLGLSPCLRARRRPVHRELRPASRRRRLRNRHCRRSHRHGRRRPDDAGARALLRRAAAHRGVLRPGRERGDEAGRLAGASAAWHRPSGPGEVAVRRIGSGGLRRGARGARTRRRRTGADR